MNVIIKRAFYGLMLIMTYNSPTSASTQNFRAPIPATYMEKDIGSIPHSYTVPIPPEYQFNMYQSSDIHNQEQNIQNLWSTHKCH